MNKTIKVDLKNITDEFLPLAKPGSACDAEYNDISTLTQFGAFEKTCHKNSDCHNAEDMASCAALLFEMQEKNNVPDEYVELSKKYAELVKQNRKLDLSECRDYVFFAYEVMREITKLGNKVHTEIEDSIPGLFVLASQDDDISAIGVVNNSGESDMLKIEIKGLPGRSASIDYYYADEYEQLSLICNTDTKQSETSVMIPLNPYSLHLFKIR